MTKTDFSFINLILGCVFELDWIIIIYIRKAQIYIFGWKQNENKNIIEI